MSGTIPRALLVCCLLIITGCGGSKPLFTYQQQPTPLQLGKSQYVFKEVKVNLSSLEKHHDRYPDQAGVTKLFETALKRELRKAGLAAVNVESADAVLDIAIDYTRIHAFGGASSIAKPAFSFDLRVLKDDTLLASRSLHNFTAKYGGLKDVAVNLQISTLQRGPKGELEDIDFFAEELVKDLKTLGRQ